MGFLLFAGLVLPLAVCGLWVAQPSPGPRARMPVRADPDRLRAHVRMLSETLAPRDWRHPGNLHRCADYIEEQFRRSGGRVERQSYSIGHAEVSNVIARFGPEAGGACVVVGAHYDAVEGSPGADDNASGVAGLLELAQELELLGLRASGGDGH